VIIDKELADAAGPRPDVSQELLYGLDPSPRDGGDAHVRAVVDAHQVSLVEVVGVAQDLVDEVDVFAEVFGGDGDREEASACATVATICCGPTIQLKFPSQLKSRQKIGRRSAFGLWLAR
jgi:hypothetical protein